MSRNNFLSYSKHFTLESKNLLAWINLKGGEMSRLLFTWTVIWAVQPLSPNITHEQVFCFVMMGTSHPKYLNIYFDDLMINKLCKYFNPHLTFIWHVTLNDASVTSLHILNDQKLKFFLLLNLVWQTHRIILFLWFNLKMNTSFKELVYHNTFIHCFIKTTFLYYWNDL